MAMKLESEIDDMVKRIVRGARTSGRLHVPKEWIGKYVIVCLLTEEQQQEARALEQSQSMKS